MEHRDPGSCGVPLNFKYCAPSEFNMPKDAFVVSSATCGNNAADSRRTDVSKSLHVGTIVVQQNLAFVHFVSPAVRSSSSAALTTSGASLGKWTFNIMRRPKLPTSLAQSGAGHILFLIGFQWSSQKCLEKSDCFMSSIFAYFVGNSAFDPASRHTQSSST